VGADGCAPISPNPAQRISRGSNPSAALRGFGPRVDTLATLPSSHSGTGKIPAWEQGVALGTFSPSTVAEEIS